MSNGKKETASEKAIRVTMGIVEKIPGLGKKGAEKARSSLRKTVGSRLDFTGDVAGYQREIYQGWIDQGKTPQEAQILSKKSAMVYKEQLKIAMRKEMPRDTAEFRQVGEFAKRETITAVEDMAKDPEKAKGTMDEIAKKAPGGKKGLMAMLSAIAAWFSGKKIDFMELIKSIFGMETEEDKLTKELEGLMKEKSLMTKEGRANAKKKAKEILGKNKENKKALAALKKIAEKETPGKKAPEKEASDREKGILTKFFKETELTNQKTFKKNLTDDLKQLKKEGMTVATIDGLLGLAIEPGGQLKRMLDKLGDKAFPVRLLDIKLHYLDTNQTNAVIAAVKNNVGKRREILDKIVTLPKKDMLDNNKFAGVITEIEKTYLKS